MDFSVEMLKRAKVRHPDLYFILADAHELNDYLAEKFDVIILSDLVNDLWDIQVVFEQIRRLSAPHTRLILNFYSRLWEIPLVVAQKLGLATPMLFQNWLTIEDIVGMLTLCNFEMVRTWHEFLWPFRTPLLADLMNKFLVKLWPFHSMALTNFLLARPQLQQHEYPRDWAPSVSVIIPARNEAGNIQRIFEQVPEMGKKTELVFVEGHSKDDTYAVIQEVILRHPERKSILIHQTGNGKGDAVRLGFSQAHGDILMVLDADLTVPPENLVRFYEALHSGRAEFANGVRLVYPMEKHAMRYLNFLGNKFFSLAFSWLLGQPIKDTLCGTKVLWKRDYERISANRSYFGEFDPFGDFDLLFGAVKLNLKIIDIPIRYRERKYGTTNIHRWKHGWLLLKMVWFASRRIKFV